MTKTEQMDKVKVEKTHAQRERDKERQREQLVIHSVFVCDKNLLIFD